MDEYTDDIMRKMLDRPDTPPVVRKLHELIQRNLTRVRGFRNPVDMPLLFLACIGAMYELNWLAEPPGSAAFAEADAPIHQAVRTWWADVPRGAPVKLNWHGMREGTFFGFTNSTRKKLRILLTVEGQEKLVDVRMNRVALLREAYGGRIDAVTDVG